MKKTLAMLLCLLLLCPALPVFAEGAAMVTIEKTQYDASLERLELPVNIAADVARIELLGNRELYIDRHRGVLAYSTEEVDVNGGGVVVRIRGEGLQLLVMTEQELRLTGKIAGIQLVE